MSNKNFKIELFSCGKKVKTIFCDDYETGWSYLYISIDGIEPNCSIYHNFDFKWPKKNGSFLITRLNYIYNPWS